MELAPAGPLADTLAQRPAGDAGAPALPWGAALDGTLAQRLGLRVGDRIEIGDLRLTVRALVVRQPDRSLRADWGGAPVLVAEGALQATGLVQPLSRVEYRYRVRTDHRRGRLARRLHGRLPRARCRGATPSTSAATAWPRCWAQIGSGLLLIGFSALFIGGLGVFNSVQAYLQGKLASLATLRALGLRDGRLAAMVLAADRDAGAAGQRGRRGAGQRCWRWPARVVAPNGCRSWLLLQGLWQPALVALLFGVLTAVAFCAAGAGPRVVGHAGGAVPRHRRAGAAHAAQRPGG